MSMTSLCAVRTDIGIQYDCPKLKQRIKILLNIKNIIYKDSIYTASIKCTCGDWHQVILN